MSDPTIAQLRADLDVLRCALDQRTAELLVADKLLRTLSPETYRLREERDLALNEAEKLRNEVAHLRAMLHGKLE